MNRLVLRDDVVPLASYDRRGWRPQGNPGGEILPSNEERSDRVVNWFYHPVMAPDVMLHGAIKEKGPALRILHHPSTTGARA
jgi:hypothetical protein